MLVLPQVLAKCGPSDEGFRLIVTYRDSRYQYKQPEIHIPVQVHRDARARAEKEGESTNAEHEGEDDEVAGGESNRGGERYTGIAAL